MQFKHFLYWTAVCCAVCQIVMALYSRYFVEVTDNITSVKIAMEGSELGVVQALNYLMPLGVGCLALLIYTRKVNQMNGIAILMALCLQAVAVDLNLRAARHVFGEETSLASLTWWAPKESNS
jgi:hypothetical protein